MRATILLLLVLTPGQTLFGQFVRPKERDYSNAMLIANLAANDVGKQSNAVHELGLRGTRAKEAAPALVALLNDSDQNNYLRGISAYALGAIGSADEKTIQALRRACLDPDVHLRNSAAAALIKLRPHACQDALSLLVKSLRASDSRHHSAMLALQEVGPLAAEAVPAIIPVLSDPRTVVCNNAMYALHAIATGPVPQAKQPLLALLKRQNVATRAIAATTLARFSPLEPETVPALVAILRGPPNDAASAAAATALEEIGPAAKAAVPDLIELLGNDAPEGSKSDAAAILGSIGPEARAAVPALVGNLEYGDDGVAKCLGRIGPSAIEALIGAIKGGRNHADRAAAAWALGQIGSPIAEAAVPALCQALSDRSPVVRGAASRALVDFRSGAKQATPRLVELLGDLDLSVRISAAIALGTIGPPAAQEAAPRLVELLDDRNKVVVGWSAAALVSLGKPSKKAIRQLVGSRVAVPSQSRWELKDANVEKKRFTDSITIQRGASADEAIGSPHWISRNFKARKPSGDLQYSPTEVILEFKAEVSPYLIELLDDREPAIRQIAVLLLARVGAPRVPQLGRAIIAAMNRPDLEFFPCAEFALLELLRDRPELLPVIVDAMQPPGSWIHDRMALLLGNVEEPNVRPAIAALAAALKDDGAQQAAARSLVKLGQSSGDVAPLVISLLKSPDAKVRQSAVWMLGQIGPPAASAAIEPLSKLLNDDDEELREMVCKTLPGLGSEAVPALIVALRDPSNTVRIAAAEGLMAMGPFAKAAGPALLAALRDEDEVVAKAARLAIRNVHPDPAQVVPVLIGWARTPDEKTRILAVELLSELGPGAKGAVATLIAALGDSDPDVTGLAAGDSEPYVRCLAASALGTIDPDSDAAARALVDATRDKNVYVRSAALSALANSASEIAFYALIEKLDDNDDDDGESRAQLSAALSEMSPRIPQAVPALIGVLENRTSVARATAAEVLGVLGDSSESTLNALLKASKDNDESVRAAVAAALSNFGSAAQRVAPLLIKLLDDPSARVRSSTVDSLSQVDSDAEEVVPVMIRALRDPDEAVRRSAAMGLQRYALAADKAMPALVAAADDPSREVRLSAVGTLMAMRSAAAPALRQVLKVKHEDSAREAAFALTNLAGVDAKAAVPVLIKIIETGIASKGANIESAMAALGRIGSDAKAAVPVLLKIWRQGAAEATPPIRPAAKIPTARARPADPFAEDDPFAKDGVNNNGLERRCYADKAAEALKKIDPQAATAAGIK